MANREYLDYEGLQTLVAKIKQHFSQTGALIFKGTVATVSALPALTGTGHAEVGYVYMFSTNATTTADFVEGAGKPIHQYDEVACKNVGTDVAPELKWCILGPVFDVSDRLQFGSSFPASPTNNDTFLYMGPTTYAYSEITPQGAENPHDEGWYESDGAGGYELTSDTEVQAGTTYYTRTEEYVHGVIYVYNSTSSEWVPQSTGDIMTPITTSEINALFD